MTQPPVEKVIERLPAEEEIARALYETEYADDYPWEKEDDAGKISYLRMARAVLQLFHADEIERLRSALEAERTETAEWAIAADRERQAKDRAKAALHSVREQALEEAAKECDRRAQMFAEISADYATALNGECRNIAAAIRSSKTAPERSGLEEGDDAYLLAGCIEIIEAHFLKTFGTDRVDAIKRALAASIEATPSAAHSVEICEPER